MLQRNSSSATASKNQCDSRPPEGLQSKARLMQSAMLDRRFDHADVHVLAMMLFDFCNTKTGACFPEQAEIAHCAGTSVETVKRAIRKFKTAGILTVEHRFRTSSIYRFVWPSSVTHDLDGNQARSPMTGQTGHPRPGRPVTGDRASLNRESNPGNETGNKREDAPSALTPEQAPMDMFGKRDESGCPRKKEASQPASKRERAHPLPPEWAPSASHEALGQELGFSSEDIWGMAAAMREHWQANAHLAASRKSDWDAAFNGWIRRECDYRKRRGGWVRPHETTYAEMAEDLRKSNGSTVDDHFAAAAEDHSLDALAAQCRGQR